MTAHDINLTDEHKFKTSVNMALMLCHVSLAYISRAEDEARKGGNFRLEIKKRINDAFKSLTKVTDWTDKTLNRSEAMYNADLAFLDRLMQSLIDNVSDSEKQGYLLDFIESRYKLPSELPEVVKSLQNDVHELSTMLDRERNMYRERESALYRQVESLTNKLTVYEQL